MSMFDMAKSVLSGGADKIKTVEAISHLVESSGGVLPLLHSFEAQGLGGAFQSWVGQGANLPVSPDQIKAVVGEERLNAISAKVGMTPEQLQAKLSEVLPQVVSHLTPAGELSHENFDLSHILAAGKAILTNH